MKVAALFTCFNRKDKTEKAIRSLVEGNSQIDFSFIVADDNSSDGTPEMLQSLKKEGYNITYIGGNGGMFYSGGMRIAMEETLKQKKEKYDYILMMNDDVDFFKSAIENLLVESCEKNRAIIVGVTCGSDGNYTYGGIKYVKGIKYVGIGISKNSKGVECDTFNANCVLIPAELFNISGGMDEHYIHALGDFDYGLRLKKIGGHIYTSQKYVGICNSNSSLGTWRDNNLSIVERIRKKESPKGLPYKIWFYFIYKHFGLCHAIFHSLTPYIRILIKR